jgi:hypothetical protein
MAVRIGRLELKASVKVVRGSLETSSKVRYLPSAALLDSTSSTGILLR